MPQERVYKFTDPELNDTVEFRWTGKGEPTEEYIGQIFANKRANEERLAQVKKEAARATREAGGLAGEFASKHRLLSFPIEALQEPLLPDIVEPPKPDSGFVSGAGRDIYNQILRPFSSPAAVGGIIAGGALPTIGRLGAGALAAHEAYTLPESVGKYIEKPTPENLQEPLLKAGFGTLLAAGAARAPKGIARPVESPKVETTVTPTEIQGTPITNRTLGALHKKYRGVPKDVRLVDISQKRGIDTKSFKDLYEEEALALLNDEPVPKIFRPQEIISEVPVESPIKGVVSIDEMTVDPFWKEKTYTPERLRQMDMQEDAYLSSIPEPLITPPPVTDLAPRGLTDIPPRVLLTEPPSQAIVPAESRAITRIPDVEPLKAAHEQMTLENNLRRLFEKEQRSRELSDVEEFKTPEVIAEESYFPQKPSTRTDISPYEPLNLNPAPWESSDLEILAIARAAEQQGLRIPDLILDEIKSRNLESEIKTHDIEVFPVEEFKSPSSIRDAQGNLYTDFSAVTKEFLPKVNDIYNRLGKVPSPSRLIKELGLNYAEALEVIERFKDTLRKPQRQVPAEVQTKIPEVESPEIPPTSAKEGLPLSSNKKLAKIIFGDKPPKRVVSEQEIADWYEAPEGTPFPEGEIVKPRDVSIYEMTKEQHRFDKPFSGLEISETPKEIIESQGLKFEGEMEGITYFTDKNGKAQSLPTNEVTPENLSKFGVKEGLQEPKEVTESPPDEYSPTIGTRVDTETNSLFIEVVRTYKPGQFQSILTDLQARAINQGLTSITGIVDGLARLRLFKREGFKLEKDLGNGKFLVRKPVGLEQTKNVFADNLRLSVKELDNRNAPDLAYRELLSTGSKNKLKQGESWRDKVLDYASMSEFLSKGGKITKLPPVEPIEPIEFGRTLEEGKVKAEKKKSLLRKFHEEESGFLDLDRVKETLHGLRGFITSANQFLDTNPRTKPIADLITSAEIDKTQWLVSVLDDLSALKKRYKGVKSETLFDILDGKAQPKNNVEVQAARDLRTWFDNVFEEAADLGVTNWKGEPIQYLKDYAPHIRNAVQDVAGMWDSIKAIFRQDFREGEVTGTEKTYSREIGRAGTPHAEHRVGELELKNRNIWDVGRRYSESMSRAMFDAPAVRKSRAVLENLPEGFDKDLSTWYLRHYVGFDSLPYMNRIAKSIDRTLARTGARSVLWGNTRLQVLHLARTLTQIWPEVPTTDLMIGFSKFLSNPKASLARARKAGLLQQQTVPMNLKTPMEAFDALGNFLDAGNSIAKSISFEANQRSLSYEQAIKKTMKDEGMVTPARPIRALETSRMLVQFKYWALKYAENAAGALKDTVTQPTAANFARLSKYAAAALAAYEIAKETGLSTWHAGFRTLEIASGVTASTITKLAQLMAAGKWDKVGQELIQYAIPGGHSIPRELEGPTFIHEQKAKKSRSFKKFPRKKAA